MMDLTPLEVRKKKGDFRRLLRGYDPASVDDFLDLVADRLEQLVRESIELGETIDRLEQQLTEFRERDRTLTDALAGAQELRAGMKEQAAREVDMARERGEHEAARIKMDAIGAREREEESLKRLVIRKAQFIQAFRTFLERELAELGAAERTLEAELVRTEAGVKRPSPEPPPPAAPVVEAAPTPARKEARSSSVPHAPPPRRAAEKHPPEKPAPEPRVAPVPKPEPPVSHAPKAEPRPAARATPTPPRRAPAELPRRAEPRAKPETPPAPPPRPAAVAPTPSPPAAAAPPPSPPAAAVVPPPSPPAAVVPPSPPPAAASSHHADWDFAIDEEEIKAAGQNGRVTPAEPAAPDKSELPAVSKPIDDDLLALESALGGGEKSPEPFDFDAAIANVTGVAQDSELVLSEEEIVPGETAPAADKSGEKGANPAKRPEGSGEFDIDDFGAPPPGPSGPPPLWKPGSVRPQELTLRPLSSEEDTPDLPAKKKKPDDDVDDMLSNLFGDGH